MNDAAVKIIKSEVLSDNWYTLRKITFDVYLKNGEIKTHNREAYDRGNGATILLYNKKQQTVVLTRQFRLPTFINGNESGMLIEACAGLLDKETGYKIKEVRKIFEAYMSPGSVTEILYFFVAEYTKEMKASEGGGVDEGEDIEVLEYTFDQALKMMETGEIKDGKTIMLLQYLQIHRQM
jgi:GDP-mannose pyrophosphatase NudK